MITSFGILIILLGIVTLVTKPLFKNAKLLQWFSAKRSLQIIGIGIVLSIVNQRIIKKNTPV